MVGFSTAKQRILEMSDTLLGDFLGHAEVPEITEDISASSSPFQGGPEEQSESKVEKNFCHCWQLYGGKVIMQPKLSKTEGCGSMRL